MRILYGAFAQGQGHFSKAAVLVPMLEARGHTVRVISSGGEEPPTGYRFAGIAILPGFPTLSVRADAIRRVVSKWLDQLPRVFSHLMTIRSIVQEFAPELVISDFEPLTASP